jgi:hypothetical protein
LKNITWSSLLKRYESTAIKWAQNPDLLHKWYFYDETTHEGGGVYIWRTRAAAAHWHGVEYRAMIERLYGYPPEIRVLDTLLHVDATQQKYESSARPFKRTSKSGHAALIDLPDSCGALH